MIKIEGLATKKDIHRILGAAGELGNLDQILIENAGVIGRPNFFKSNLERDADEITKSMTN